MKIFKTLKGLFLVSCLFITGWSQAQSISPWGMSITGKTITDGKIYISYTLGEVFSGAVNGNGGAAIIGILQPEKVIITSFTDLHESEELVKFYPNPATDIMHISDPEGKVHNITICNVFGEPVLSGPMSGTIDLEILASGMYTIRMFDKQDQCIYSSKVTKL